MNPQTHLRVLKQLEEKVLMPGYQWVPIAPPGDNLRARPYVLARTNKEADVAWRPKATVCRNPDGSWSWLSYIDSLDVEGKTGCERTMVDAMRAAEATTITIHDLN